MSKLKDDSILTEGATGVFMKISCPVMLVASPIALILFYSAPNPPEDHVGFIGSALMTVGMLGGMLLSFWYCKYIMGWFGGQGGGN